MEKLTCSQYLGRNHTWRPKYLPSCMQLMHQRLWRYCLHYVGPLGQGSERPRDLKLRLTCGPPRSTSSPSKRPTAFLCYGSAGGAQQHGRVSPSTGCTCSAQETAMWGRVLGTSPSPYRHQTPKRTPSISQLPLRDLRWRELLWILVILELGLSPPLEVSRACVG
jgi:hypothetical protein